MFTWRPGHKVPIFPVNIYCTRQKGNMMTNKIKYQTRIRGANVEVLIGRHWYILLGKDTERPWRVPSKEYYHLVDNVVASIWPFGERAQAHSQSLRWLWNRAVQRVNSGESPMPVLKVKAHKIRPEIKQRVNVMRKTAWYVKPYMRPRMYVGFVYPAPTLKLKDYPALRSRYRPI